MQRNQAAGFEIRDELSDPSTLADSLEQSAVMSNFYLADFTSCCTDLFTRTHVKFIEQVVADRAA